jgi:subtilisin family serine protease
MMSKNRTRRDGLSIVLFLTLFLPMAWAEPNLSLGKKHMESIYLDGKSAFFTFLENKIPSIPFNKKDKTFLLNEKFKKKGLYEHLMNFYFFLHDINDKNEETYRSDFLRISEFMAEEFLQSILFPYQKAGYSSLNSMLVSSGYFSRKTLPDLRKFLRPLGKRVKSQDVFQDLNIIKAHSLSKGAGVRIAIIDSGVDPTIKEFKGRIKKYKNFLDSSKPFEKKGTFPFDFNGHGTSVTTLINRIAPKAELMIIKFYETDRMKQAQPSRWTAYLAAAGMIWAVQNGADIINLSAAFILDLWPIKLATQYCWDHNVIVVTPMGNSFDNNAPVFTYFPASYPWTIAVGGTEKTDGKLKVWEHSGKGNYVDIVAPATDLLVERPSYLEIKLKVKKSFGNSLAVGFVTGASALILSAMGEDFRSELKNKPGRMCEEVRRIIRATASNEVLGLSFPNLKSGYGMIEIQNAILLTLSRK